MINFLLWNIAGNQLHRSIDQISKDHKIDIIILIESKLDPAILLTTLNRQNQHRYFYSPNLTCQEEIQIFTKLSDQDLSSPFMEDARLTLRKLRLGQKEEILIGALHMKSKLYINSPLDQLSHVQQLMGIIKDAEKRTGHTRTILLGDFNMDPFEANVAHSVGFNAVMSREIARQKTRTQEGGEYAFFYNPMWSLLGDNSPGPPGTYYYSNSAYYWHTFDQVLIRPALVDCLGSQPVKILDSDGERSLLTRNGLTSKATMSDHLPLVFQLDL